MKHILSVICLLILASCGAFAALSTNLDSVKVYPNPCQNRFGQTSVTFDNLTSSARIRIYRLTGEEVYDGTVAAPAGRAAWGTTTTSGEKVGPGTYIYLVTNDGGQKRTGKLVIAR